MQDHYLSPRVGEIDKTEIKVLASEAQFPKLAFELPELVPSGHQAEFYHIIEFGQDFRLVWLRLLFNELDHRACAIWPVIKLDLPASMTAHSVPEVAVVRTWLSRLFIGFLLEELT